MQIQRSEVTVLRIVSGMIRQKLDRSMLRNKREKSKGKMLLAANLRQNKSYSKSRV